MLRLTDELCSAVFSHVSSHTTTSRVSKRFRDLTKKARDAAKAEKRANAQALIRETFPKLNDIGNDYRAVNLVRGQYAWSLDAFVDSIHFNTFFVQREFRIDPGQTTARKIHEKRYLIKEGCVHEIMWWGGLLGCVPLADFVANHFARLHLA